MSELMQAQAWHSHMRNAKWSMTKSRSHSRDPSTAQLWRAIFSLCHSATRYWIQPVLKPATTKCWKARIQEISNGLRSTELPAFCADLQRQKSLQSSWVSASSWGGTVSACLLTVAPTQAALLAVLHLRALAAVQIRVGRRTARLYNVYFVPAQCRAMMMGEGVMNDFEVCRALSSP